MQLQVTGDYFVEFNLVELSFLCRSCITVYGNGCRHEAVDLQFSLEKTNVKRTNSER